MVPSWLWSDHSSACNCKEIFGGFFHFNTAKHVFLLQVFLLISGRGGLCKSQLPRWNIVTNEASSGTGTIARQSRTFCLLQTSLKGQSVVSSWESKGPTHTQSHGTHPKNKALLGDDLRDKWLFNHGLISLGMVPWYGCVAVGSLDSPWSKVGDVFHPHTTKKPPNGGLVREIPGYFREI